MKPYIAFLAFTFSIHSVGHCAPSCSRANLNRCLDSVCAINVSSNPSARCQYCGTSNAGTPPTKNVMKNLSVGASSKYTLSDKELKNAPSDPGQRYVWATQQCLEKLPACTADDVSESYDKLIEQSCKAAGISAKMSSLRSQLSKKKSASACSAELTACMIESGRCGSDYRACEDDTKFSQFFSTCSTLSDGCEDNLSTIRDEILANRDAAVRGADTRLAQIIASYQNTRENKTSQIKSNCQIQYEFDKCVQTKCNTIMPNRCGADIKTSELIRAEEICASKSPLERQLCIEDVCAKQMPHNCLPDKNAPDYGKTERSAAEQLCKYYTLACDALD